jgi:hypothetical protein
MYFGVAVVSTLLNFGVLVSYLRGSIAGANKTAYVSSIFTWVVMLGNLIVWCVAAALYRSEKATDDLWGWACSDAAKLIQREFADQIDFGESCNVQVSLSLSGAPLLPRSPFSLIRTRKGGRVVTSSFDSI